MTTARPHRADSFVVWSPRSVAQEPKNGFGPERTVGADRTHRSAAYVQFEARFPRQTYEAILESAPRTLFSRLEVGSPDRDPARRACGGLRERNCHRSILFSKRLFYGGGLICRFRACDTNCLSSRGASPMLSMVRTECDSSFFASWVLPADCRHTLCKVTSLRRQEHEKATQ